MFARTCRCSVCARVRVCGVCVMGGGGEIGDCFRACIFDAYSSISYAYLTSLVTLYCFRVKYYIYKAML